MHDDLLLYFAVICMTKTILYEQLEAEVENYSVFFNSAGTNTAWRRCGVLVIVYYMAVNLKRLKNNATKIFNASQPQEATPCAKARHTTYRSLRSVHPFFCTAHPFTHLPNDPMLYIASQSARHSKNSLSCRPSTSPYVFSYSTRLSIPNCISIGSAILGDRL